MTGTDGEIIKELDNQMIMEYNPNNNVKKDSVEFNQCLERWKGPRDRNEDTMRAMNNAGVTLDFNYSEWS